MLRINGEESAAVGETLLDYLTAHGYDTNRLAVERNGEIVRKQDYANVRLCDGDEIEIVSFVGGG